MNWFQGNSIGSSVENMDFSHKYKGSSCKSSHIFPSFKPGTLKQQIFFCANVHMSRCRNSLSSLSSRNSGIAFGAPIATHNFLFLKGEYQINKRNGKGKEEKERERKRKRTGIGKEEERKRKGKGKEEERKGKGKEERTRKGKEERKGGKGLFVVWGYFLNNWASLSLGVVLILPLACT